MRDFEILAHINKPCGHAYVRIVTEAEKVKVGCDTIKRPPEGIRCWFCHDPVNSTEELSADDHYEYAKAIGYRDTAAGNPNFWLAYSLRLNKLYEEFQE